MWRLIPLVKRDFSAMMSRARRRLLLWALVGLFGFSAYAMALAGLAAYLSQTYGIVAGIFAVAVSLAILSLLIVAAISIIDRRARRRRRADSTRNLALATLLATAIPALSRQRNLATLAAAGGIVAAYFAIAGRGSEEDG